MTETIVYPQRTDSEQLEWLASQIDKFIPGGGWPEFLRRAAASIRPTSPLTDDNTPEPASLPWEEAMREPGMLLVMLPTDTEDEWAAATRVARESDREYRVYIQSNDRPWYVDVNGYAASGTRRVRLNPNYRRPAPIVASGPVEYAGMNTAIVGRVTDNGAGASEGQAKPGD